MNSLQIVLLICVISFVNAQRFGGCYTPDEYRGECIYLEHCQPLLEIYNRKPLSNQDRLFLSLSQCGFRDEQPLVCCRLPEVTTAKPYKPPPASSNNLLPQPGECGFDIQDRIYGGNVTKVDEFPWLALLQYTSLTAKKRVMYGCGGVLINTRYVLTASHCVNGQEIQKRAKSFTLSHVRLGEWDLSTDIDCDTSFINEKICNDPPIDVPIEQKIPHENYNPDDPNQHNDIALLRLSRNVEYTHYIRPICLPVSEELRSNKLVDKTLNVAGWGKTETRLQSQVKLKANVEGVTNDACQNVYRQESRDIIESQLCAGGVKCIDSCSGDSGGPLMRQNDKGVPSFWYLAGLVSFGPTPCGQAGWPGIYTRVANYFGWIEANVKA